MGQALHATTAQSLLLRLQQVVAAGVDAAKLAAAGAPKSPRLLTRINYINMPG
jgi:hypothetical protein